MVAALTWGSARGAAGKERAHVEMQRRIERRIVVSNAILEAFGNATTLRNENSSRFGKYLSLCFGADGRVCGAAIQTYLLELSRVVHHAPGERSYHVFYQLCHGADSDARARLGLRLADDHVFTRVQAPAPPSAARAPASPPVGLRAAKTPSRMHMSMV
jgi:myosin heavy subunit